MLRHSCSRKVLVDFHYICFTKKRFHALTFVFVSNTMCLRLLHILIICITREKDSPPWLKYFVTTLGARSTQNVFRHQQCNLYEKNEKSAMKVRKSMPIASELSFSRRTFLFIENDDVTK